MDGAFYVRVGDDEFASTEATTSPWDPRMQHGGPPAGLLARAVEMTRPDADMPIARLTVDMLGPIPQGRIRTEARILRPGRRVEMIEAKLFADDRLAVTATAWRIQNQKNISEGYAQSTPPPPLPGPQPQEFFTGISPDWGYGNAIEWRFVDGSFTEPGPVSLWARVRLPLVAGETPSTIQHLAVLADSTNGVSGLVPLDDWLFIPPTMTMTVARPPEGPWLHLAAHTTIAPHGTGVAQGTIRDPQGLVAVVDQPLLVRPR
ncbi:thioesterase family protein [Actinoplanes sichuanensis]|uniref:Thioesterase family protein n=1 Tax=Actinoplanes sichuanensis TaxID=512349 RepID=A0ABW4AQ96_9ACTN|nr:thioesterase family protein [Actinoplanes sichuanensis]